MLLVWALIYQQEFSPLKCYTWNTCNILYKNKSLFSDRWFDNGINLVKQRFNKKRFAVWLLSFSTDIQLFTSILKRNVYSFWWHPINWKKVSSLPQKWSNKAREVSFTLIHRFYPVKHSCFSQLSAETCSHLSWSCKHTQTLERPLKLYNR